MYKRACARAPECVRVTRLSGAVLGGARVVQPMSVEPALGRRTRLASAACGRRWAPVLSPSGATRPRKGALKEKGVAAGRTQRAAAVGVAEQGNSVVLVTVGPSGELLDRRRVDLTVGLPTHPHHHEGSWAVGRYLDSPWARKVTLAEALALVERVRASAALGARERLEALAASVPTPITKVAIRVCPRLPPTTEERIADARAQTMADSVMYRQAVATAAEARGWAVHWYDPEQVFRDAAKALGADDIEALLRKMGSAVGPPWQAKHKLAAAAALACR